MDLSTLKAKYSALALTAHKIVNDDKLTASEVREALDKIEGVGENPPKDTLRWYAKAIEHEEYLVEKRKEFGGITGGGDADTFPVSVSATASRSPSLLLPPQAYAQLYDAASSRKPLTLGP